MQIRKLKDLFNKDYLSGLLTFFLLGVLPIIFITFVIIKCAIKEPVESVKYLLILGGVTIALIVFLVLIAWIGEKIGDILEDWKNKKRSPASKSEENFLKEERKRNVFKIENEDVFLLITKQDFKRWIVGFIYLLGIISIAIFIAWLDGKLK